MSFSPQTINTSYWISTTALSPNGKYIASAGASEYLIQIWNPTNGEQIGDTLKGHTDWINSINYSQCGNFIVSVSDDRTIRQWNLSNFQQQGENMIGHDDAVQGVEYSQNDKYIISCSSDKTIRCWDSKTGKEQVNKRFEHYSPIQSIALSSIQSEIAFGDVNGTIVTWNYEKKQQSCQLLRCHNDCIYSIKYSLKGKFIVSGGNDLKVLISDLLRRKQIRSFIGHIADVRSLCFSPDQNYFISGGNDNIVRIWNRATGEKLQQFHHSFVYSTKFSLCGNYIITAGFDKTIRITEFWARPDEQFMIFNEIYLIMD